jgi:hypothetical protein
MRAVAAIGGRVPDAHLALLTLPLLFDIAVLPTTKLDMSSSLASLVLPSHHPYPLSDGFRFGRCPSIRWHMLRVTSFAQRTLWSGTCSRLLLIKLLPVLRTTVPATPFVKS